MHVFMMEKCLLVKDIDQQLSVLNVHWLLTLLRSFSVNTLVWSSSSTLSVFFRETLSPLTYQYNQIIMESYLDHNHAFPCPLTILILTNDQDFISYELNLKYILNEGKLEQ
uniref:Uncharacterized protein n=1 Tax=Tetranychus urticae TaxID=32264 RepID=T1KIG4_TETUR